LAGSFALVVGAADGVELEVLEDGPDTLAKVATLIPDFAPAVATFTVV